MCNRLLILIQTSHFQIQTSLLECHVTEYLLTLMSNKSENQEIVSRSESYYIRDLLPGIEYKIKLTAKTNNGALESSPIYSAIPRMKGKLNN